MTKKFFKSKSNYLDLIVGKPTVTEIDGSKDYSLASIACTEINYALAIDLEILPIATDDQKLKIYCKDKNDLELFKKLKFILGHSNFYLQSLEEDKLRVAIYRAYNLSSNKLEKYSSLFKKEIKVSDSSLSEVRNAKSDIAKFICTLIDYAHANLVSDIHIVPEACGFSLRLRKNGEFLLHEDTFGTIKTHKQVVQRIKTLANLDISNSFVPQDGSFNIDVAKKNHSLRVSTMPTIYGERVVLRLFPQTSCKEIIELGFSSFANEFLGELLKLDGGLILTSGSTGSGKTSTLYALVLAFLKANKHVVTLEDPVEIEIPGAIQSEINLKQNFDYATGFKAILRQDPDVVLIGEIRDKETAQIALEASETGHIILSTIHGRDLQDVESRFTRYKVSRELFRARLKLLISQKLLPKLCKHCRVEDDIASSLLDLKLYKAGSCSKCNFLGYNERLLVFNFSSFNYTEEELAPFSFKEIALQNLKLGNISYQDAKLFL